MAGYEITDNIEPQLNNNNLTGKFYYNASCYSDPTEHHVLPGTGRTFTFIASFYL